MLKEEKNFVNEIKFERSVDLIFSNILERLYRNQIAWEDILSGNWIPVDHTYYKYDSKLFTHYPYKGQYKFHVVHQKEKGKPEGQFELQMTLAFKNLKDKNEKEKEFKYTLAVTRKLKHGQETPASQTEEGPQKEAEDAEKS